MKILVILATMWVSVALIMIGTFLMADSINYIVRYLGVNPEYSSLLTVCIGISITMTVGFYLMIKNVMDDD